MTGGQWMDRLDQRITDQLGFANRGAVYNIVASALKAGTTEAVDNLQHLQGARLDALQQALWTVTLPLYLAVGRVVDDRQPTRG